MNKKRVLIVGHGFVGKALENSFQAHKVDFKIIDPKYKKTISEYQDFDPQFIFICVPTPSNKDGSIDYSILESVVLESLSIFPNSAIVIKSTVLPNFKKRFDNHLERIILNPEFLTEKDANQDFINSNFQIFGGNLSLCKKLEDFLKENTLCNFKISHFVSVEVATLIKYGINSFLAMKVIFFNQFKEIFEELELSENDYSYFIDGMSLDKRIGKSHMQVPGPDGRHGFGGACFPKDTNALLKLFIKNELDFSLLSKVIEINNELRKDYNDLLKREIEQNISFDISEKNDK